MTSRPGSFFVLAQYHARRYKCIAYVVSVFNIVSRWHERNRLSLLSCLMWQLVVDVELLGFVYHWGLDVNSITVIGGFLFLHPSIHPSVVGRGYGRGSCSFCCCRHTPWSWGRSKKKLCSIFPLILPSFRRAHSARNMIQRNSFDGWSVKYRKNKNKNVAGKLL